MEDALDQGALMDRIYRWQCRGGFYDATRKYYLLARDPMIEQLDPPAGGTVLEIGCGTGRNLVRAAQRYSEVEFHGIDISREMLNAACGAVARRGLQGRIRLVRADATTFVPTTIFGRASYDRIFISYAMSMIPQWRTVMTNAAARVAPGGELHIADFGDMAELPSWSKAAMYEWLRWYHVTPRPDLLDAAAETASAVGGQSEQRSLHRGFSWMAIIRRP